MEISEEEVIDANIYVVCEVGWEYNDNDFYRSGSGGIPQNAFTLEKLASEYCKTKNYQWFVEALKSKYMNPSEFIDNDRYSEVQDFCKNIPHLEWDPYDRIFICTDFDRLKTDDVNMLITEFNIEQYEVVAIKLVA